MAETPRYRTLSEDELYTAQLITFIKKYSAEAVDAALLGIYWGISRNPTAYPQTTWNMRQAKSRCLGTVPAFKILFNIQDENVVILRWIEEIGTLEET
jgi:hypothetical protein